MDHRRDYVDSGNTHQQVLRDQRSRVGTNDFLETKISQG
jgi:hypothetical protein